MNLTDIATGETEDVEIPSDLPWLESKPQNKLIVTTFDTISPDDYRWTIAVQRWALYNGYMAPTEAEVDIEKVFGYFAKHLPGKHDQEDHGNRGAGLAGDVEEKGGFTYNPIRLKNRDAPKDGFALSLEKRTEKQLRVAKRAEMKAQIQKYVRDHWDQIKKPGNYLGGWKDGDKVYLDISTVIADRNEAVRRAKAAKQLAIYDLGRGKTIKIAA